MDADTHAQIIEILDKAKDMTIATVRSDGFPQATVVAYVHDNLRLYFWTGLATQKALNISACDKVSATIAPPYRSWAAVEGISLGGHASLVADRDELRTATTLMKERFPEAAVLVPENTGKMAVFRVDPVVISLIDYGKGLGHAELIEVEDKLVNYSKE